MNAVFNPNNPDLTTRECQLIEEAAQMRAASIGAEVSRLTTTQGGMSELMQDHGTDDDLCSALAALCETRNMDMALELCNVLETKAKWSAEYIEHDIDWWVNQVGPEE